MNSMFVVAAIDFTVIIASIAAFLLVILVLVGVLLYARKKLLPQGKVKLSINDEKEIEVAPGSTLLSTLSTQNIFYLPHAGVEGPVQCARYRLKKVAVVFYPRRPFILRERNNRTTGVWVAR
jgi:Na+-transporting NADH:ubiquinone oxidoreductase subunit NqrF